MATKVDTNVVMVPTKMYVHIMVQVNIAQSVPIHGTVDHCPHQNGYMQHIGGND